MSLRRLWTDREEPGLLPGSCPNNSLAADDYFANRAPIAPSWAGAEMPNTCPPN